MKRKCYCYFIANFIYYFLLRHTCKVAGAGFSTLKTVLGVVPCTHLQVNNDFRLDNITRGSHVTCCNTGTANHIVRSRLLVFVLIRNFFFPNTVSVNTYSANPAYESAIFLIRSPEWKFLNTL